jgi:transaldolase
MKGIERRLNDGKSPMVESVASLFVSRWDTGAKDTLSDQLQNKLGIAIAMRTYKAYRELLASERWKRLAAAGAHPQRLLWASTGTKDPKAPETLYVEALAAPDTVNTMPEKTLKAFAKDGHVGAPMPVDGGYAEQTLDEIRREGVDIDALAARLQKEGGDSFAKSWHSLIGGLEEKITKLTATSPS